MKTFATLTAVAAFAAIGFAAQAGQIDAPNVI